MAKKRQRIPQLVHHEPSGQARVRINGRDIYLGKFGSTEAEEKYHRTIAEWIHLGRKPEPLTSPRGTNQKRWL